MAQLTMIDVSSRLAKMLSLIDQPVPAADLRIYIEGLMNDAYRQAYAVSDKHEHWSESRPTVAVDFDGVLHRYTSKWNGPENIPDPPMPGAIEWLAKMVEKFNVMIFSARGNSDAGINAMQEWLMKYGLPSYALARIRFEPGKPSAWVFIDDRAIQFNGNFWDIYPDKIAAFRPWYYGQTDWKRGSK